MIQPYLRSAEYKIVLLAGRASHFVGCATNGFSFGTEAGLMQFAEEALRMLASRCAYIIPLDGLWRVDIMMDNEQNYKVNEFEHLDALFSSKSEEDNIRVNTFLENYWHTNLCNLIKP